MSLGALIIGLALLWSAPAAAQAPDRSMERAVKLYGQKQYLSATVMLHRVLTASSATLFQKQRAEFLMGKALFLKRLYASSFLYFSRVVNAGSAHPYWKFTLLWLAALQSRLSPQSGILRTIGQYPASALNAPELRPVRNKLLYLLGRYHMLRGD